MFITAALPLRYIDMLRNDTSTVPVENRQDTPSGQQHRPVGARVSSPPSSSFSAAPYVGRDLFDNAANGCSQSRPSSVKSAPEPASGSGSASASAPVAEMFVDGSASEGSWCGPGPTPPVIAADYSFVHPGMMVMTVIAPLRQRLHRLMSAPACSSAQWPPSVDAEDSDEDNQLANWV